MSWARFDRQEHKVKPDRVNPKPGRMHREASRRSGDIVWVSKPFYLHVSLMGAWSKVPQTSPSRSQSGRGSLSHYREEPEDLTPANKMEAGRKQCLKVSFQTRIWPLVPGHAIEQHQYL